MHTLEPFYNWRHLYIASEDERSPFFGTEYSEFEFVHSVYNYFIHPQWDEFGSATLYAKILFTDYLKGFTIIELLGEWNDCLYNDIKFLKQNVADVLTSEGVSEFILIGENVMNFHSSDDCYYQEWMEDTDGGRITAVNFRRHVAEEFARAHLTSVIGFHPALSSVYWRSLSPFQLHALVEAVMAPGLNP